MQQQDEYVWQIERWGGDGGGFMGNNVAVLLMDIL
jgi:hypothetical protein